LLHWGGGLREYGDVERAAARDGGSKVKIAISIYRKTILAVVLKDQSTVASRKIHHCPRNGVLRWRRGRSYLIVL
jgi:hypothetical protein